MASGFDTIAPAGGGVALTPSDSAAIGFHARALYIGVTGDIALDLFNPITKNAVKTTFTAVPAGTILPVSTFKVYATGTTATSVIALA